MPLVTPTPITALDGLLPPSSSDPVNFDARGDAFLGAFPTLQTQINTVGTQAHTNASFAQEQASSASTSAATAATQAAIATTQAASAAAAAAQAASAAGVTMWVSGSYGTGALAWSPTSYLTYRRKSPGGSSPTDPALDTTNWSLSIIAAPQYLEHTSSTAVTGVINAEHNLKMAAAQFVTMPTAGLQVGDILWVAVQNGRTDNYLVLGGNKVNGEVQSGDVLVLDDAYAAISARWTGAAYGWRI